MKNLARRAVSIAIVATLATAANAQPQPEPKKHDWPALPVPLADQALPTGASERPTLEEWKTAAAVEPTRRSRDARVCRLYVVREWLKVHCERSMVVIDQLAGSTEDVLLWVDPKPIDNLFEGKGGEVIVPMRRGDRRLFQMYSVSGGDYGGVWSEPSFVIEETWLEKDAKPTVIVR